MFRQKQNLLWLMIICCATCQINCSNTKIMITANSMTNACSWDLKSTNCAAIYLTCLQANDTVIGAFKIMNVKIEPSCRSGNGYCRSYSFNITYRRGKYEVGMNETFQHNTPWLLINIDCPSSVGCLQTHRLYPKQSCENTIYNNSSICGGSRYVLYLEQREWICVKCDNTTGEESTTDSSEEITTTIFIENESGSTQWDPSKASDILEKLKSEMEEMKKNKISKAAIVMWDVTGLFHVQDENTETKDICYSSEEDMINVADCQSDLKAGFPWSVKISSEAFNKSRQENNGSAFLGILPFKNMRNKNETKNYTVLNDEVYGMTMGANISKLTNNIDMLFRQSNLVGKASCVSWDGKGELIWTTFGCKTETNTTINTIKCSCSHLTFFAVLMIPQSDANVTAKDLESLTFISYIGCGISLFFLSIALFMHFLLRKAKSNQATKILMNMFVALLLLNVSFLSNESVANTGDNSACVFIALLLHYSMLASFTWFFIQALHMYLWLIRQNVSITNYMRKITVLGWVFPAPIVIAIVSVGEYKTLIIKTSEKNSRMCWITNPYILYTVNIGYYALVFIFTTGIFITILTRIVQARRLKATDGKRKTFRKQLMMVLSLFLLFGLTWSVAFFSYGPMLIPSYYIFTVLNSLQGFFLFLYYYHIHNDISGRFSDDPRSSGSTTTMVQPNMNGLENVYNQPN